MNSAAIGQPGTHYDKVWLQGQLVVFSTTFNGTSAPYNQLIDTQQVPLYFSGGNSSICDAAGNPILLCDGFNLYDKNRNIIDGGKDLAPAQIIRYNSWSGLSQSSIILPFSNGIYRLITPTASDDFFVRNWRQQGPDGALYDLLLYDEIDMKANGGAGKVTKRMAPMLEDVRLSKTQMMACRHGDGKSWWLLKQASDTNMVYKFLMTDDKIYGPAIQGFTGDAGHLTFLDINGQSMFSKDGTKYATAVEGSGKVFMADFDRCSGILSKPRVYYKPVVWSNRPLDPYADTMTCGLCFSPNGRYLYVSSFDNIHQLDLQESNPSDAWTLLSGPDTTWDEFQNYSNIYPGPDGKLYIGNWGGFSGQMSVINNPDSKGLAANFCPKCLRFPGFMYDTTFRFVGVGTPPCMPNYALGATNPVCYPTKVEGPASTVTFHLYPNPAQSSVSIDYDVAGELKVYDLTGRLMGVTVLKTPGSTATVSVTGYAAGIYQYIYSAGGQQLKMGKLVVSH